MKRKFPLVLFALFSLSGAYFSCLSPNFNFILGHVTGLFAQDRNYPLILFLFFLYASFLLLLSFFKYNPSEKTKKVYFFYLLSAVLLFTFLSFFAFFSFLSKNNLHFDPKLEYSFLQKDEIVSTSLRHIRAFQPQAAKSLSFLRIDRLIKTLNPQDNPQLPTLPQDLESQNFLSSTIPPWMTAMFFLLFVIIVIFLAVHFLFIGSSLEALKYASIMLYLPCSFSLLKNLAAGTFFDPEFIISFSLLLILLRKPSLLRAKGLYIKILIIYFFLYILLIHYLFNTFIFFKATSLLLFYAFLFLLYYLLHHKQTIQTLKALITFIIILYLCYWGGGSSLVLNYDYAFFKKLSTPGKSLRLTSHKNIPQLHPLIKTKLIKLYEITSDRYACSQNIRSNKKSLDLRALFYPIKAFGTNECNAGTDLIGNSYYGFTGYLKLLKENSLKIEKTKYRHAGWWILFKKDEKDLFDYVYIVGVHKCISSMDRNITLFLIKDILKTDKFIIAHHENF